MLLALKRLLGLCGQNTTVCLANERLYPYPICTGLPSVATSMTSSSSLTGSPGQKEDAHVKASQCTVLQPATSARTFSALLILALLILALLVLALLVLALLILALLVLALLALALLVLALLGLLGLCLARLLRLALLVWILLCIGTKNRLRWKG
jgi:hypothetical protein